MAEKIVFAIILMGTPQLAGAPGFDVRERAFLSRDQKKSSNLHYFSLLK